MLRKSTEFIWKILLWIINAFKSSPAIETSYLSTESDEENNDLEMDNANESYHKVLDVDACVTKKRADIINNMKYDVDYIENSLDLEDKIAFIFLLNNESTLSLQDMSLLKSGSQKSVIKDWCLYKSKTDENWYDMLLETLAITQNYRILSDLGISKIESQQRFLPYSESTLFVNKTKKILYLLFEDLEIDEINCLFSYIKNDLENKNMILSNEEFQMFNEEVQLEYFITYLLDLKYITLTNLKNFNKCLKSIGKTYFYEMLSHLEEDNQWTNNRSLNITNLHARTTVLDRANSMNNSSLVSSYDPKEDNIPKYNINPNKPGYCLIINQEHFYKELSDEKAHLVVRNLDSRIGTEYDVEALKNTFSNLNFKVKIKENQRDDEILEEIKIAALEAQSYSSLFVCALSHGIDGEIIGANSVPVSIKIIKNNICQYFENKPKVLILQMCQGKNLLEINSLVTDSPDENEHINYGDIFTFYATVSGFAAVRDKNRGTWFIQTFCNIIDNATESEDFNILATKIKNEIRKKKWKKGGMVSEVTSTFCKLLYLPKK